MSSKQGNGKTGQIATTLAIVMAGKNTFGMVDDFKSPDWEFEVVNEESTNIIKSPKVSFSLMDLDPRYIGAMKDGEPFILKGNIRENGVDVPYSVTMTTQLHKIGTEIKEGENVKREFEARIDTYEEIINGKQSVKYNRDAMELILGGDGVNLMAKIAKNTL